MTTCKKRLAVVWFIGAGVLFVLLIFETLQNQFGSKANEAWAWFLPTILPTLSLITGVFAVEVLGHSVKNLRVDPFFYRLTVILSLVYLVLVGITILFNQAASSTPLTFMKQSNLWLGPLQGIVATTIGVFFVKR
jgi:uncharacterized membrane protein SirB2